MTLTLSPEVGPRAPQAAMQLSEQQTRSIVEEYDQVQAELNAMWAQQKTLIVGSTPADATNNKWMVDHKRPLAVRACFATALEAVCTRWLAALLKHLCTCCANSRSQSRHKCSLRYLQGTVVQAPLDLS